MTKTKEDQQVTVTIAYPAPAGIDGQEGARRVLAEMLDSRAEDVRFKLGSTYGLYIARAAARGPERVHAARRRACSAARSTPSARASRSRRCARASTSCARATHFDEDFVRARRKLISDAARRVDRDARARGAPRLHREYGLDSNYYNTLLQQIAAVSPAQIKALIKTELDPNNEVIVVLGDKAHLDKTFADAGHQGRQDRRARLQEVIVLHPLQSRVDAVRSWVLALLAACYAPHLGTGSPCSEGPCPTNLVCSPATQTCELVAVDAASQ